MQIPVRLLAAARPGVPAPMLAAIAASTSVFVATPFLIRPVALEYDVSTGAVGWISTAQLAGFVLAAWGAGRFLKPSRTVFVSFALLAAFANLASTAAPTLAVLALCRVASGFSLGLAAWFGWQAAFGDQGKTGDVAVIGPLVGVVTTPLISWLAAEHGPDWVFGLLAAVSLLPLVYAHRVRPSHEISPARSRHPATKPAAAILVALAMLTFGGSSVFVFAAAIGTERLGLSTLAISLGFTFNAIAGIPAAKWRGARGMAGVWVGITALLALLMATTNSDVLFLVALVCWGFVFFMGTPTAFVLLAERSRFPEERAGDAQAVMALGRVFGPLMGGALYSSGSSLTLGIAASTSMFLAGLTLIAVDRPQYVVNPAT